MPTPRRRWFAFRLRTLFVVVAVLALLLGWVVHEYKITRDRDLLMSGFEPENCPQVRLGRAESIPWMRRMMGDVAVERIVFPALFADDDWSDIADDIRQAFPEAQVSIEGTR